MNYRLSMCFTLACLLAYASRGAELHGQVLDNNSAPVAGWPIILSRTEPGMRGKLMATNTSPSGHFYYKDIAIGEYYLVLGRGYLSQAITIAESGWSNNIVARPAATSHTLSVRILQIPDNSEPLKVRLGLGKSTVLSDFNRTGINCPADSTVYAFTNLFAGSYTLFIESPANIMNICNVILSDLPEQLRFEEAYERLVPFTVKLWQGEHEEDGIIWSAGSPPHKTSATKQPPIILGTEIVLEPKADKPLQNTHTIVPQPVVSGAGIITHLEMDPSNPGFGFAHIQMLDTVGQEKGIHQYEVAISPNTIASIFSNLYRQSDTDAPHLALSEWPVKIGKPYFFEISPRTNTYLLKSIGSVVKENVKQVRTTYLASGWFQIHPEDSVILSEEIQELELELLKLGDHCAAQRIAETYPELVKPLRTRHRELYSIYAELHSHLKQIPPHATIVRSVKYPKDYELSISGIVLDVDGHPVQGKTVALLNNRIELDSIAIAYPLLNHSDQTGYFHFDNLEQGIYDLFVVQPPLEKGQTHIYSVYTTSVISVSSESVSNVELKPVPAPRLYVQAEVLSYDTGKPVPSEMELFPLPSNKITSEIFLNPDLLKPIKSLKSGLLSIPNLSTGDYLCTIYGDSRQKSATFVLTITEDNSVEIETKWKVLLGRRGIPARFWTMKWPPLN